MEVTRETELRKLNQGPLNELIHILEYSESWKKLMSTITKNENSSISKELKYSAEHIRMIENAAFATRGDRLCSAIFIDEWSTSGRKRVTLGSLLALLVRAQLFRAADYVAQDLLGEDPPERPGDGPAAKVMLPEVVTPEPLQEQSETYSQCPTRQLLDEMDDGNSALGQTHSLQPEPLATFLPHEAYADLSDATAGFDPAPLPDGGRKLGTGAFGSVFLGRLRGPAGYVDVAVKRLDQDTDKIEQQFRNEVEALSRFCHENLLPLLGYSCDGPLYCLVYEYMPSGSLYDRLAKTTLVFPWQQRLDIGLGTARGINHLHTAFEKALVHRDVKTANILLDQNLAPKLGDFGLVRLGGQHTQSVAMTTRIIGTSAYMAPEAFRGDISAKMDVFSFGVVLLELLTSLAPHDEQREGCDLVTHMEETCSGSIAPLLDTNAGDWGAAAEEVFNVALDCLKQSRQARPSMGVVVARLTAIGATYNHRQHVDG